jgi:uncharacterized protein YjbI with pentapeptide repeats
MWKIATCPVEMGAGVCGRPVHRAPKKVDAQPVCLMHSKDPAKRSGVLYSEFLLEFKAIISAAGTGTADFTLFVFPHLSMRSGDIEPHCVFSYADFEEEVYLYNVTFKRDVDFMGANFLQPLSCRPAVFAGKADFQLVNFKDSADFSEATFSQDVNFRLSKFFKGAYFKGTPFHGKVDFRVVSVRGLANFSDAIFSQPASLANSSFRLTTLFLNTTFGNKTDLSQIHFKRGATFRQTKFLDDVSFEGTTFGGDTHFSSTEFEKIAYFNAAKFLASASFSGKLFRSDKALEPGPIFSLVRFSPDATTLFYKTDLSHALFHSCDITDVTFSSVIWRKRPHNQNLMVYEEDLPLDNEFASTLNLPTAIGPGPEARLRRERDYGLIAQLYQQLKKNYDDHLDYWAADHFHYGEMEMQRLAVPTAGPLLKLRQFYHRHLSLIAWYRRGSSYGNSYLRPAAWLVGILLFFTLLFPLIGLVRTNANPAAPPSPSLTYRAVWPSLSPLHDKIWAELKLLGKSALTTIDTASFQKNSEYAPTYPSGRALAILETLLAATLFALFLLAIRRQFRR